MTRPAVPSDNAIGQSPPRDLNKTPDDPQWVMINSTALHWDIALLLGDGFVTPSGGAATFDEVTVPNEKTIVSWNGEDLWRLEVPIMIDAWIEDLPIPTTDKKPPDFKNIKNKKRRHKAKDHWRKVRDKHYPSNVTNYLNLLVELSQPQGKHREPAALRLYGKSLPRFLNGELWRLTAITWGDTLHNERNGNRVRQALGLTLVEANDGKDYKFKKRKRKSNQQEGQHNSKKYTVKKGDTLMSIAAKFYGDANKWERIAKANNIKNPRKLDVGDVIKIPM